jgi:hypothetical protein
MNAKYDVIDTFSRRPVLSALALDELRTSLETLLPGVRINPEIAVVTEAADAADPATETLFGALRENFATGKTLRPSKGRSLLVADPSASTLVTFDVDAQQLAILIDSVSLGLPARFMQAMVKFWDSPGVGGATACQALAKAFELQNPVAVQGEESASPDEIRAQSERKALNALQAQLPLIQDAGAMGFDDFDDIERYLAKVTDITPLLDSRLATTGGLPISRQDQLPDWLTCAPSSDRLDYSRRIAALAVTAARAAGHSWDDGLPPIVEYARRVLQEGLREDHPQATHLSLDDVTVHVAKVVASPVPSTGQIIATGSVEHIQMTVANFALGNLSSLPNGTRTLSLRDGGPLPAWFTPDYLQQLVTRVDIGRTYPALVRRYLITDAAQVMRRRALFAEQLMVQLPLKALEQKIRGQGGLTQAGYRIVCSLLESSHPEGVILHPLAWAARPGATADVVQNMFVIGNADSTAGPLVLYRPFAPVPLTEFASWSTLRDAIVRPGEVQDDVLTWMTERGRDRYANGGFQQPHINRFGLGSDFAAIEQPEPAQLVKATVQGDVMTVLFNANARALADLADQESVSNAESRWAMLQRGGWLALDTVMPFLSGGVGAALWLVQLMGAVDRVLVAQSRKADHEGLEAWNGLLLTISMILLHQGFPARPTPVRPSQRLPSPSVADPDPLLAEQSEPLIAPGSVEASTQLNFSWSSSSHRLTEAQRQDLERLRVLPEPLLSEPSAEPGKEGLHQVDQHWYVQLDSGAYEVGFSEGEVHIVDPQDQLSSGPRLLRTDQGWALDLTLKLRGGGPKRNVRQMALENAATLKRVTERDAVLDRQKKAVYKRFSTWDQAIRAASAQIPADLVELAETDLNELVEILKEKQQLQSALRPVDRASEKTLATDLQDVSQRVAFLEGVLLSKVVHLASTQMARLKVESGDVVTPQNLDAYLKLFEDLEGLQSRGVHWSSVRGGYWQQLRSVPKFGRQFWVQEVLETQRANLFTFLDWRITRMWSLLELSFSRDEILSGASLRELKSLRIDEGLHAAFSSQAELEKPNDYTLAEQIGVLESSLREYERAELIAICAHESMPHMLNAEQFQRFSEEFRWISGHAQKRLSDLIRESAAPEEQPYEYVPRIRQPRKRVIKTRGHRMLVGRLREGEEDLPGAVVEVMQAMTENVVGTYHSHEDGEYVEVVRFSPPEGRAKVEALAELKRQATAALERVEPDIDIAHRQSRRANEPADMEDILVQKAEKLKALAEKLAVHTAGPSHLADTASGIQTLIDDLRASASRLVEEGRTLRIFMIKAQPPTAARLSYLASEHEVDIARFEGRKNLSGRKRNDFLQEYVIRDKHQRVLWWAHFHYASEAAAADAFTAAHLKLPEQRFIGYKAQLKAARDDKEVVSIYRSYIGKDVAQRLFLSLA